VERDDSGGAAWEVEVQKNGQEIEVRLTDNLKQVGIGGDDSGAGEGGESSDDD